MKIHEFQAKQLLAKFNITVPNGVEVTDVADVRRVYDELEGDIVVVKAQIHAGGRGKGGGVKVCKSADEAVAAAEAILGMQLVTHQTGPEGQKVRRLWLEEGTNIDKEYYAGVTIDRKRRMPVLMCSTEGGMDIEEVAEKTPEKIHTATFGPDGLDGVTANQLVLDLRVHPELQSDFLDIIQRLTKAFLALDCDMVEINPLATSHELDVIALDAKMSFDSNAMFRHPELEELRDVNEEDPRELEAAGHGLSYISLDGSIGCMVNGAGLAMATMDVIKLHGAEPANFLDVGGGATKETVAKAFALVLSDPKVKGVLVNIFGGIMKCDVIAAGVIAAVAEIELNVPLVVRLEGTNVEIGKKMLEESGLPIITASDLDEAAMKITEAIKTEAV
ncbi:MAG: ADP-forming succinate--CoA ligase subunit beta [Planctomycetota bacterium]|nr:ADP-forming succinate--CoA ligase subunit beta [Planctomycetota bacterium]MDG2143983.1 ADP-forming succinate--CoA ligase subunit beta [Planctomycetota bacterium]